MMAVRHDALGTAGAAVAVPDFWKFRRFTTHLSVPQSFSVGYVITLVIFNA